MANKRLSGLETHLKGVLILHRTPIGDGMSLVDHMTVYFDRLGIEFKYTSIPTLKGRDEDAYADEQIELPDIMVMIELKSAYGSLTRLMNPDNYPYMFRPRSSVQHIIERERLSIQFNAGGDSQWLASYPVTADNMTSSSGHGRHLAQAVRNAVMDQALRLNKKHRIEFKEDDAEVASRQDDIETDVDAGPDSE